MIDARKVRSRDLPTKRVIAQDGSVIQKKVVQAEIPTLAADLLAAFRWNVQRILDERQRRERIDRNDRRNIKEGGVNKKTS
ncbi:MAG: hypothetical protein ABIS51_02740 [Sphingomonas sp.]